MKLRAILLGTAMAAVLPGAAMAAGEGFYVGAQGGVNWQNDADLEYNGFSLKTEHDLGWAAGVVVGYKTDLGIRAELEATYRRNELDKTNDRTVGSNWSGNSNSWAFMGNVLYDFNTGTPFTPYIGAGAGIARVSVDLNENYRFGPSLEINEEDWVFAYQGIVGVSYNISNELAVSLDYRYFATVDPEYKFSGSLASTVPGKIDGEYSNHTIMLGLRYSFGAPASTVAAAAATAPAAATVPQSEYLVFFDWNRSDITPASDRIIADAAAAAGRTRAVGIHVIGHTDSSGSPEYNQRLSLRRAEAVKRSLSTKGVPANQITIEGKGESQLLVATGPNVREPSNRRAQVLIKVK